MNRKIPPWRGGSRSVLEAAAEFLLEVRRQPFECVHGGEDGRAAALREVAKAREKFVFLSHGHVTFGRDDEHDVEAAGGKTGQAVDARIVVAVFEAFVGGDWNAEQLCDLLLRIAKSFAFVAEAFSDFLTLFCGGRGHDSVVVELLGRRSV